MGQAAVGVKVCVLCGEDCSGKPRVKDPQGKYMCKACHEKAQAAPAAAHPKTPATKGAVASQRVAAVAAAVSTTRPDSAFDSLEDNAAFEGLNLAQGETQPCTSCGVPIAPAIIVCPSCGFNRETGKGPRKVKVSKDGPGAAAVAGAAANVLIFANPLTWIAAGLIGGAVGAGGWYLMVVKTGLELRLVTLAIGVVVGMCIKLVSGKYSGAFTGGLAVAITLVSMVGAYYLAFQEIVGREEKRVGIQAAFNLDDEDVLVEYARELAETRQAAGQDLNWPDGSNAENAERSWDFPRSVWVEAEEKWAKAPADWKARYKADVEARLKVDYEDAKGAGFIEWAFLDRRSLIAMGVSLLAALWVGSGGALAGTLDAVKLREKD